MADGALSEAGGASGAMDRAVSRLLRYDLSRSDVGKWVEFARQIFLYLLVSVVTIAGLMALLSTKEAEGLLKDSLKSQGETAAGAIARAAFVPVTLDDEGAISSLVEGYRSMENLGGLSVRDARGQLKHEISSKGFKNLLTVTVPILPLDAAGGPSANKAPIGTIELSMRTDWIAAKARTIALTNVAISAGLAAVVLIVGLLVIRNLVDRTKELVGEARMVEEVKRANAELDAFSYSVAHDLRAPVRAIDGFSNALLESCSDKLDADGKDYLARVLANSKRMGLLIDDLLNLSRVTRSAMSRQKVDLSALAREVAARLKSAQPDRNVDFVIADGIKAEADPGLVRAGLENLLGNAWKYSQNHPKARIEFGRTVNAGKEAFFVRDDGAGFDMAHAKKLFQPFSRLHSAKEFEGTGIGLATVHRIMTRHGGNIWAEGEVEKGSTFYFTLEGDRT